MNTGTDGPKDGEKKDFEVKINTAEESLLSKDLTPPEVKNTEKPTSKKGDGGKSILQK